MTRDHQLMEMRSLVVDVIRMIGFPKLPSTQINAGVGPIPMYTFSCFRVFGLISRLISIHIFRP